MKTLVIGDIHGNFDALMKALENADHQEGDRLVFLGVAIATAVRNPGRFWNSSCRSRILPTFISGAIIPLLSHLYPFIEVFDDRINEEFDYPAFADLDLSREAHP